MKYLPVLMDIKDKDCLVVGGGAVALRKIRLLLRAGAEVRVVAKQVGAAVAKLAAARRIELSRRGFRAADLKGAVLAVAATNDLTVNKAVSVAARRQRVLLNAVDEPELCDFIVPAVVESGSLLIAVSTSGAGPGLAARIAAKLRAEYGKEYDLVLRQMSKLRRELKEKVPQQKDRKKIIDRVLDGRPFKLMMAGKWRQAKAEIDKIVSSC